MDRFKNDQGKNKTVRVITFLLLKKKIAGVDEVGRGCLAGPVYSAAVILDSKIDKRCLMDSKKISFKRRIFLSQYIKKNSIYSIGIASVEEINKLNILNASLLSMKRALLKLKFSPTIAYVDGLYCPKKINIKCKTFIKGDEKISCISAASIIAKVARDLYMIELSKKYPRYKWNQNFGYGTKEHQLALKKFGVTTFHRKKFSPIHNILMRSPRETQQV